MVILTGERNGIGPPGIFKWFIQWLLFEFAKKCKYFNIRLRNTLILSIYTVYRFTLLIYFYVNKLEGGTSITAKWFRFYWRIKKIGYKKR